MFEIDKEAFGAFLAEQRKAKGYTQKTLAEKLFVSDKAVSKWERGLSMPDISLLAPLSDILGISVTELLEGKKIDSASSIKTEEVETIVKKALALSEETPEKARQRKRRNRVIFGLCTLAAFLETAGGIWFITGMGDRYQFSEFRSVIRIEIMLLIFTGYFWRFVKEKLPTYYDENKIHTYSDGVFRLNIPGIRINNTSWPRIIKCMRYWLAAVLVTYPAVEFAGMQISAGTGKESVLAAGVMAVYLAGLFLSIYISAKKC